MRFKSYSFWTALAGAVVIFLNALGKCFGFSIDNDLVTGLIMAFAGILVVLGVVTMPTDKTDDDQSSENSDNDQSSETDGDKSSHVDDEQSNNDYKSSD